MGRDTLLGFPSHTLPYRYRKYTTLSTVSKELFLRKSSFFLHFFRRLSLRMASFVPIVCSTCTSSTSSTTATSITRYL